MNPNFQAKLRDRRTMNVLGFFVAKKLLLTNGVKPRPTIKLKIQDVLWVADQVEPRVYEILPAALLHFPATFVQKDILPNDLKEIVFAIGNGVVEHAGYKGIEYAKMRFWVEHPLSDRRTKPLSTQRRRNKTFRLPVETALAIADASKKQNVSESRFVENLVNQWKTSLL